MKKRKIFLGVLFFTSPKIQAKDEPSMDIRIHRLPVVIYNLSDDNNLILGEWMLRISERFELGLVGGYFKYDGSGPVSTNSIQYEENYQSSEYKIKAYNLGMRLDYHFRPVYKTGPYLSNAVLLSAYESQEKENITSNSGNCFRQYKTKGQGITTALAAGFRWYLGNTNFGVGFGAVKSKPLNTEKKYELTCDSMENLEPDLKPWEIPWLEFTIGFHF